MTRLSFPYPKAPIFRFSRFAMLRRSIGPRGPVGSQSQSHPDGSVAWFTGVYHLVFCLAEDNSASWL